MKYFVVSDIHGHYNELIKALNDSGFDKENENHTLISLGDHFDRGDLARGVFNYIYHLPRKICLKGNHELLLEDLFKRGYVSEIDRYNGLISTISSFSRYSKNDVIYSDDAIIKTESYPNLKQWLSKLPYIYETKNHIFVHGWLNDNIGWENAVWADTVNNIKNVEKYKNLMKDKILVFGHRGSYLLHQHFPMKDKQYDNTDRCFDIWYDKEKKLIGIDSSTIVSKKINVFIFEE